MLAPAVLVKVAVILSGGEPAASAYIGIFISYPP
jgi:hypothetical protein